MAFSTQEFAATIKKKYPQYNEMPDDSLALLVIKKYPQYKEQVDLGTLQAKFIPQAKEYGLIDDNFQPIAKTSLSEASGGEFSFLPSVQAGLNAQPAIPGVTMAPSQRQPMPTIQDAPDINTQIQASVAGMGTTVPNTKANVMDQNWEATKLTAPDPAELSSDEVFRQGNQMQLRLAAAQKKWDEDYKAGLIPMKTVEVPGDMGRPATMSVPSIARPTENSFAFAESGVPLEQGSVQAMAGEIGTLAENVLGPVTGLVLNRKPGERRAITFNEKKLAAESIRMEKELSQKEASGIELTPEEKELKETLKPDVWESLKAMAEQVYEDPKRFIELNVPSLTAGILMAPAMDAGIAVVASRVKEAARVYKMAKVNKILRARRAERLSSAISGGKAAPVFNSPVDDIVARYGQQVGLDNARKAVADALIAGGDSRLLANSLQKMGIQTTKGQRRLLGNIGQEMAEEVGPVAFAQTVTDWGQGRGDLDAATIVTNVFASLPIAAVGGAGMGAAGAAVRSAAGSPSVGMDAPTADRVAGKMILNRQATPDGGAVPTPNYAQGVAETVGSPEFKPTAERIAKTLDNPEVSRHYEKLVPEIGGRGMDSRIEGAGEGAFVRGRMQDRGAFTIGETAYGGGKDAGIHEAIHGVERFIRSNPDSHGDVDEAIQDWKDNAYEQLRTERPDLFESLSKMTRNAREAKEELFTQSMVRSLGLQDNDWGIPMETGLTERFASYLGESEALKANKPSASNMNFDGVGDGSDAPFSVLKKNENQADSPKKELESQPIQEPQFQPEDEQYSVLKAGIPESRANDPKLVEAAKKAWKEKGTESPWFKKWFGDSKVVDADGNPLVVYHGTRAKFSEFDQNKTRDIGIHFGNKEQAKKFGDIGEYYINANMNEDPILDVFSNKNLRFSDMAYELYDNDLIDYDQLQKLNKKYDTEYHRDMRERAVYLDDREDSDFFDDYLKETKLFWSDAKKELEKNGYNGIRYKNNFEGKGDSYVVFSPTQIKSATGNRGTFDQDNADIRYSTLKKQEDSPEFKWWFNGSKVTNKDGDPLVMYHGTPNYGFAKFNEYSHFTQDKKYAERYMNPNASSSAKTSELMEAKNPGIYKVYLSIKNPFDTRNAESKKLFESEYLGKYGNNTPLSESGLPDWTDANDIVDWIKETGKNFDGVIVDEGGDEGGSRGISYIPLNPNQVKLAEGNNGEFSLENDDIRFSLYPRNEQQQAQKEIIKAAYAGLKKNGLHLQNGISYQDISQKWGAMPKNLDDEGKKAYRKKWDSALESLRETIQEDESTALMAGIRKSDIDEQNIQDIVWKLSDWANAMAEKPKKGDVDPETRKWLSNATPEQVAEYEKAQAAYAASGKKQKKLSRYEEKNTPPKGTSAEEFNTAEDFNPKGDPTASKKDAFGGQIAEGEQAEEWKDLVVRRIYDYLDPLKKVQKRVTGSTEGGVTHEAMLQASRAQDKVRKAKEAFLEPVRKIMERSGLTLDDVDQYLYARHALERNEQIAKVNKDFQDPENFGGSGMSNKTARAILKSFEIDQPKKFEALKRIGVINDRMNKWRLDYGRSMGILSEEEAEAYEAGYKHYVPLRGRPDEITGETVARPGISKGMQARKDEKRALGRRSLAMNVTAQNFTRTLDMIANAERNKVGLALAKMIRENPDPEYWTIDKTPMKLVFDKKTGEAKPAPDMKMDAPNEYAFYENGERHVMRFHTPEGLRLASALKGMSEQSGNTVLKVVSMLNRFVAGMVTSYSPEFVLSNASRDAMTASITSSVRDGGKVAAKTLSSAPKAAVAIMGREFGKNMGEWGKYYERFQKAGGKTAFLTMIDFNEFAENIKSDLLNAERSSANPKKVFKALITGLERVNAGVENGTRLAYFRTLTESGMSDEQAALKAKELTVNFERHGEYKWMNQLWMFMNAALQGTSNVARLFTNPKTRKAALVAASSLVSLGAMNAIFNKEFGGKDEKSEEDYWDRAKAWERDRNLIFLNPISKDGTGPKIPLPYEFSFFIRLGQELADLVYGKKAGQAALNIANSAVSAVSPLGSPISVEDGEVKNPIGIAIPTPLQPFADIERNRGFDGRPIMPEDSPFGAKKPDSQKYFKGVNPILRDATAWMNEFTGGSEFKPGKIDVSPETIEHLINAYTGGIGQLVQRVGGLGKTMTTEGEKVELRQIPFVRKFFRGDMGNDRADFKRIADLSEQSEAEYMSYLEKGQEDKANAFEDENYLLIQTARIFKESGKGVDWNSTEQKAEVTDLYKRAKRQFKRAEEIDLKLKNEGNSDRKKMYKNQIDSLLSSAWDGYMESIK